MCVNMINSLELEVAPEVRYNVSYGVDVGFDFDLLQDAEKRTELLNDIPRKYEVFLYNDDFTPMEFVVKALQEVFRLSETDATSIMMKVHYSGKAVCGCFSKDIAQTKADQIMAKARLHSYPLLCKTHPAKS